MKNLMMTLIAAAAFAAVPAQAARSSEYSITKTIMLGTPDVWDYLTFDAPSGRVYIAHGDRVTVVDGKTGQILGDVAGMPGGTHGIAIVHAAGKGYTDDGEAGEIAEFDLGTQKVVKRIKAAEGVDGIIFDAVSEHVFAIDGDAAALTVIDPMTEQSLTTVPAGGALEFGVSGDNGKLYVNGSARNEIVRVDLATNQADAHWAIPDCTEPRGMAVDVAHHRLFSSCSNQRMAVMDADSGREITTVPIGEGSDSVVFDPNTERAYSSNRDGTISVIQERSSERFEALTPIKTQYGARTMAIDPATGRLYVVTADITVNQATAPNDYRHRYSVRTGTVRLLFLDPSDP